MAIREPEATASSQLSTPPVPSRGDRHALVLIDVEVLNVFELDQERGLAVVDAILDAMVDRLRTSVRPDDVVVPGARGLWTVACSGLDRGVADEVVQRLQRVMALGLEVDESLVRPRIETRVAFSELLVPQMADDPVSPGQADDVTPPPHGARPASAIDSVPRPRSTATTATTSTTSATSATSATSTDSEHDRRLDFEPDSASASASADHWNVTPDLSSRGDEQDRRIAAILRHSTLALMLFDGAGTIAWASPACAELFGERAADLVGRSGFTFIHPDDQERAVTELSTVLPGGHARSEFRVVDAAGGVRWIEEFVTDLLMDPQVGFIVGNMRDVSDRREAERSVRAQADLLGAVGRSIVATDRAGVVEYWNQTSEQLFGWTAEEAIGRELHELVAPPAGREHSDIVGAQLEAGLNWSDDVWLLRHDGSRFLAAVICTPVRDEAGELTRIITVSSDLTERLELARAAEDDRRRLADAQRNAKLGSFEMTVGEGTTSWSDEMFHILGVSTDVVPTRELYRSMVHPDDREAVRLAAERALRRETDLEVVHRIIRTDGETRWILSRTSSVSADGTRVAGIAQDITDRYEAELKLYHQAEHDSLTDLPNRVCLARHLDAMLERQRHGGPAVTVAFLDLDRFKVINDGLGHAMGDRVLLDAATRLLDHAAGRFMVGRFGGDEFVVITTDVLDPDAALNHADDLARCLETPFVIDGRRFFLTASIGVAQSRTDDDAESVLQAADMAMYESKKSIGGRSCYFDDRLQSQMRDRLELENDLRQALVNRELELHYQPIIRTVDQVCVGFESLLRWMHPRLGRIDPGEFIPLAEETGLILAIGEWVVAESVAQIGEWQREMPEFAGLRVAVNLSANQLASPDLITVVSDSLAAAGVHPSALHLEITESVLMDRIEGSLHVLNGLRRLGVHLAVDDFGTGYSSLSYLKRLPVDMLKIDRSFVDGLGSDPHDTSIVQAIIGLADALSLSYLAEGVETDTQLQALVELGCPLAQGFLWARAMPASDARVWLDANRVSDR